MNHFIVDVFFGEGEEMEAWRCVTQAQSIEEAEAKGMRFYRDEGYDVAFASGQLYDQFEHGDFVDYEFVE
jgi:hypothetical protein